MKSVSLSAILQESVSHNPNIQKKVMLTVGDAPNLVYFSQACFKPGQVAGAHAHTDMSEVFFIETGDGTIYVDGVAQALHPGTCIVVKPGETHELINTGVTDLVLIYFGILA
ncbi:MAG TPA: cupin domain-containing protein [Elainellaceae cyanobacterium]